MSKLHNLFLQQSYKDLYTSYNRSLSDKDYPLWDYVVLTASNETQAEAYRKQIEMRQKCNVLNNRTNYLVVSDPEGKRVGSGGATLNVIKNIMELEGTLNKLKIFVIHSGGNSKRVPQYSACGKLFSPVPRELPGGRHSTLFDEIIIESASICTRIGAGMFVCSGDVLLLFNPLQMDYYNTQAAVFSIKEDYEKGSHHGVYTRDMDGNVARFLHKKSPEVLKNAGAVDSHDKVNIDTGAVFLSTGIINEMYSLICDKSGFEKYINEEVALSFYADFLYPMASDSTLREYYCEIPENSFSDKLHECRTVLWKILNKYRMQMFCFSPASFIHFGTTRELHDLLTVDIDDYSYLGWTRNICSNSVSETYSSCNSYISDDAVIGKNCYIEDSVIGAGTVIGDNCVISGLSFEGKTIPGETVLHGLKLNNGMFTVRSYGLDDNPKEAVHFGKKIDIPLWDAKLFPVCNTIGEALDAVLESNWRGKKISLFESFNCADMSAILAWQTKLKNRILFETILDSIRKRISLEEFRRTFSASEISPKIRSRLIAYADRLSDDNSDEFSCKNRIYYYLSEFASQTQKRIYLDKCYATVRHAVVKSLPDFGRDRNKYRISESEVITRLPVRINFGGGWSDTPPHCLEHGGTVLNAAITLDGNYPIEVTARRIPVGKIILESADNASYGEFTDISELKNYGDPFDAFALQKAALCACEIIPTDEDITLEELTDRLGGGIRLSTRVYNIPRGSGLGTSSILSAACVKCLYELLGISITDNECYQRVLCIEQIMSTGGGWQDQVGGASGGIKLAVSMPGLTQDIKCTQLSMSKSAVSELNERFCLIYTGQRRLARNLLREIVGKYIASDKDSLMVLREIQQIAVLMKYELEKGNIDEFAAHMNKHWELSKILDGESTNTCIDQIFLAIDDMTSGKMICGAGGGGFLQIIMKKGISREQLSERLTSIFSDTGVDVRKCEFII